MEAIIQRYNFLFRSTWSIGSDVRRAVLRRDRVYGVVEAAHALVDRVGRHLGGVHILAGGPLHLPGTPLAGLLCPSDRVSFVQLKYASFYMLSAMLLLIAQAL